MRTHRKFRLNFGDPMAVGKERYVNEAGVVLDPLVLLSAVNCRGYRIIFWADPGRCFVQVQGLLQAPRSGCMASLAAEAEPLPTRGSYVSW